MLKQKNRHRGRGDPAGSGLMRGHTVGGAFCGVPKRSRVRANDGVDLNA